MKGGWELNLALMGIAAALLLDGPGLVSAHELWGRRLQRRRAALLFSPRRRHLLGALKLIK